MPHVSCKLWIFKTKQVRDDLLLISAAGAVKTNSVQPNIVQSMTAETGGNVFVE